MENATSVQILSKIKEVKTFEGVPDIELMNEHLSKGWIIIATSKNVDGYGNEVITFYLGYPQEQPKSH